MRQITVRLPEDVAVRLEELATIEKVPVAEEVRTLLGEAIKFAIELPPVAELETRAVELARKRVHRDPHALRQRINSLEAERRGLEEKLNFLKERDIACSALVENLRQVERELEEARSAMRQWANILASARAEVAREVVRPVCEFLNEIAEDVAAALGWLLDIGRWAKDPALCAVAWGSFRERLRRHLNQPSPVEASFGKDGNLVQDVLKLCLRP